MNDHFTRKIVIVNVDFTPELFTSRHKENKVEGNTSRVKEELISTLTPKH